MSVGIGIGICDKTEDFWPLPTAVAEVRGVADILTGHGFDIHLFLDENLLIRNKLSSLLILNDPLLRDHYLDSAPTPNVPTISTWSPKRPLNDAQRTRYFNIGKPGCA